MGSQDPSIAYKKMGNRKIGDEADKLQKAEDQNNMMPIWDYQHKLSAAAVAKNGAMEKYGADRQGIGATMRRLGERTSEWFRKENPHPDQNRTRK